MAMDIPPPPSFRPDGDRTGQSWRTWKQGFEVYLAARDLDTAPGKRKVSLLLHFLGPEGVKLYNTFVFRAAIPADADHGIAAVPAEDKHNLDTVMYKFGEHYGRGKMRNTNRQAFLKRDQHEGEKVMDFIADLKHKIEMCEYGDAGESILCDRIIDGLRDEFHRTKRELIELEENLNLENCIKICRREELTSLQLKQSSHDREDVHRVQPQSQTQRGRGRQRGSIRGRGYSSQSDSYGDRRYDQALHTNCQKCLRSHPPRRCPAFDEYCGKCGTKGHYARSPLCTAPQKKFDSGNYGYDRPYRGSARGQIRGNRGSRDHRRDVHFMNDTDDNEYDYKMYDHDNMYNDKLCDDNMYDIDNGVDQMTEMFKQCNSKDVFTCNDQFDLNDDSSWYVNMTVTESDKLLRLKIDTGAGRNVLSMKTVKHLAIKHILPSNLILNGIHSTRKSDGVVKLECMYKSKRRILEFEILKHDNCVDLLGKRDSILFGLIARIDDVREDSGALLNMYSDVFDGSIGCIPGQYHIKLSESADPVVVPPRPVPVAIRKQVKEELDHLERCAIIRKVEEPTEWVSPMVCVRKPTGRVRLCIDPHHLNKSIKREHYPMRSLDDILTRLSGSKYFSVLDAYMGFYQICLDENSSYMTTFSTPFGRYRHLRMPMGISSAPEIYQRAMDDIFGDLDGVEVVMDDILVHGSSAEDHTRRLEAVLMRARKVNLKLNSNKTKVAQSEVNYVGHLLSSEGVKPNADRIKSIVNMREPQNIAELQTILGMISYVAKFIPHLSDLNAPLRELKKSKEWLWGSKEQNAFERIKRALTSKPLLKYYDVDKPVTLSVDASRKGLGAAVIQDGVVAYASRALTPTEQRYAQIELEMLAIVFGCQRFHHLIYGKADVTIESDHKPLENLHKKPLHSAPMRIQRMMLKLQPYTYTVRYEKGINLGLADCLSRLPQPAKPGDIDSEEYQVCRVDTLTCDSHDKIASATAEDDELQAVKKIILTGWPDTRTEVPPLAVPYWEHRDELATYENLVFRGERICVPKSLRPDMLKLLHAPHLGIVYTKQRARDIIFWPRMNSQIEDLVSKCPICLEFRNKNQKEPMNSYPVPKLPWSQVSVDLFELYGKSYIVIVDSYSGFIEIEPLQDTSAHSVIRIIKANIARYGIMNILVSDNGPQFSSREFCEFSTKYQFQHITSSPEYQQSNGLAERAVQTAKRLIKKAIQDNSDIYLALLELRNTPRDSTMGSPTQRLMGRRTKTLLPTSHVLLRPATVHPETVEKRLETLRSQQKVYYDKHSKPLPEIKPGDTVRLHKPAGWTPAELVRKHETPRSYVVKAGTHAHEYRRNRRRLMVTGETPHVITPQVQPRRRLSPLRRQGEHLPAPPRPPRCNSEIAATRIRIP